MFRATCRSFASRTPAWPSRWSATCSRPRCVSCSASTSTRASSATRYWEQHEPRAPSSIKAGVMGLGVIGAQVARALSAQGFAVRGYARSAKHVDGVAVLRRRRAPRRVPRRSRFPGLRVARDTGDRRHPQPSKRCRGWPTARMSSTSAAARRWWRKTSSRCSTSGKLAGATLDVFRKEPLPADHPFWRCPEIVVTPHISGPHRAGRRDNPDRG